MMKKITFLKSWFLYAILIASCTVCVPFAKIHGQLYVVPKCSNLGSNLYGPMNSVATANATSRSAVIYPINQLSTIIGQLISNIYFNRFTTAGTMGGNPNFKIYLKEVSIVDWAGPITWATEISGATLVYDGNPASIVGSTAGWKNFPLTNLFSYSGTNNLAVFMEYTNTASSTLISWNYEYTEPCVNTSNSNTTKYVNNTTGTLGLVTTGTDFRRPEIAFDLAITCYPPTNIISSNATLNSVDVSWTSPATLPANGYEYYYSTSNAPPTNTTSPSGVVSASTSTNTTIGSLAPGTQYYLWMRSVCSSSDKSPWLGPVQMLTLPSNDNSSTAIPLTINPDYSCDVTTAGLTHSATQSAEGTPSCSATGINDDVWYSFVATNAAHRISFSNVSSGTMVAGLYEGTPGGLTQLTGLCASTTLNASGLTVGNTYYIRAYTTVATATTRAFFNICVGTPPPPPVNNNSSNAIALAVSADETCTTSTAGTTVSATPSPESAPTCSATGINDDVWYSFVAGASGNHSISFSNVSSGTMVAALYEGVPGSLSFITGACASTTLTKLGLTSGVTYYVRAYTTVATVTTEANFDICVTTLPASPINDNASNATSLMVNPPDYSCGSTTSGTTFWATESVEGAATCSATGINDDVWYTFTATNAIHRITFSNVSGGTMVAGIYTGTPGSLTQVGTQCASTTLTATGLTPGNVYYVRAYTTVATATTMATFDICVATPPPPPVNDNSINAIALTVNGPSAGCTAVTSGYTHSATNSAEAATTCSPTGVDDDVWYTFVAQSTAQIITFTNVTSGTMASSLYTGIPGSLTFVTGACASTILAATSLSIGTTYYVRAYTTATTAATTANFDICIASADAPSNDDATGALTLTVGAGCSGSPYATFGATAGALEPVGPCHDNTTTHPRVWFKFTAPASGAVKITTDIGSGSLTDTRISLYATNNPSDYSSFNIIACDEDNGVAPAQGGVGPSKSTLFTTGLLPATEYYVLAHGFGATTVGSFCLAVDEINSSMLSSSSNCAPLASGANQIPYGTGTSAVAYTGWVTMVDAEGKIIANVRNLSGINPSSYSNTFRQNINSAGTRTDGNGIYYLDRNYRISNSAVGPYEIVLYFSEADRWSLFGADPSAAILSNLNITRVSSETSCSNDFLQSDGTEISLINQTASGTANGVSWVRFTTPSLSQFYIHTGATPLPVKLASFTGKNAGTINTLNWKTTEEKNFSHFELQRSKDGVTFHKLAVVNSNRNAMGSDYAYNDERPFEGKNYYRINMVDVDGRSVLSEVIELMVIAGTGLSVNVYPNPVSQQLNIEVAGKIDGNAKVIVSDMVGKIVRTIAMASNTAVVDMNNLPSGIYMIKYSDNSQSSVIKVTKD